MVVDRGNGIMMHVLWALAAASLAAWIGLLVGRGLFWWPAPRLERGAPSGAALPPVVAVIPARNEAGILPRTLPTVLAQDYAGPFRVVLVDDRSEDETASVARSAADGSDRADRLTVLGGKPLPTGWSGKVWAMHQGAAANDAEWLWFADADIAHDPWVLSALVDLAERGNRDLVSTMATLRIDSTWDRLLIPAFVYFFAKLYPFRFV
ncbi:glycosyltransferase, partial [Candidatus Bipolaricaulota bacterium]